MANPTQIRWLYRDRVKTDRRDARKLAILLSLGQLPQVYLPPKEVSSWRSLITFRHSLVKRRTAIKNQLRALPRSDNRRCPSPRLWNRAGRRWLRGLLAEPALDAGGQLRLEALLMFFVGSSSGSRRAIWRRSSASSTCWPAAIPPLSTPGSSCCKPFLASGRAAPRPPC